MNLVVKPLYFICFSLFAFLLPAGEGFAMEKTHGEQTEVNWPGKKNKVKKNKNRRKPSPASVKRLKYQKKKPRHAISRTNKKNVRQRKIMYKRQKKQQRYSKRKNHKRKKPSRFDKRSKIRKIRSIRGFESR